MTRTMKQRQAVEYAYVFYKLEKRYADNKSNCKTQRVGKRRYQYVLSRVEL